MSVENMGTPLPGMSDTATPVNASAVPQPGDVAATAQGATPAPPPAAPAPQPTDQKQPFWKALLQGALRGLAGSAGSKTLGGGLAGGAQGELAGEQRDFNNKITSAQSASGIRFQDIQSAKAAADINRTGMQIAQMGEDQREAKEKFGMAQVDFNQRNFGSAYKAVPFTQDNARLYLQQASSGTAGAHVPDGVVVTPSTLYIPVSDSENSVASDYTRYKTQGDALGLNPVSRAQYMAMNPAQRRATTQIANDIFSGNAQPAQVNSRINLLQASIAAYGAKPGADPGMLQHMKDVLSQYQNLRDMNEADKDRQQQRQEKTTVAAAKARNDYRGKDVIDPTSGQLATVTQKDAIAGRMTPAGPGIKAQQGIGLLNEIDVGAKAARDAISGLKQPFTGEQQIQLATAMAHGNMSRFLALKTLTPDQKAYVTSLNSLREGALSYRGIAGQGVGSDSQRQALFDALPNPLQPRDMQLAALNRFDQQRNAIRAAIPKVNNATLPNQSSTAAAKSYTVGNKNYNIPADKVAEFMREFPNAKEN